MDCKSLMIGDWVFDGDEVARVTLLTCDGIIETTLRLSNIEIVTPIPLTAEILEKNGWKYNPTIKAYEWQDKAFYISIHLDERTRIYVVNDYIFGMALVSVHELQHALRLCGIDKEIVL